ncbi:hypothetical protein BH11PSE5_BH11PSE5_26510 [soil metagenome]
MPDLPLAIAAYFKAKADADVIMLGEIFAPDAHVHDEENEYTGINAIRAWRVETFAQTPFSTCPIDVSDRDGTFVVRVEVSGAFPNNPVMLNHSFALVDGLISWLDIR